MSTKLYINGQLADLGDAVISENRQINNFFELRDRQTSFTNKFVLPFTPINKEIYEGLAIVGIESTAPYRIGTATTIRNGIPTIVDGRITVSKFTNGKGYDTKIQYGVVSFFDAIKKRKVSELDYTGINHPFSTQTYENSFGNTHNDGYIYALADYGIMNTGNVAIEYQPPSIFRRWIWDRIWSEAGFMYEYVGQNNPFESDLFINTVMSITEGLPTDLTVTPPVLYNRFVSVGSATSGTKENLNISERYDALGSMNNWEDGYTFMPKQNGYFFFDVQGAITGLGIVRITVLKNGLDFFIIEDSGSVGYTGTYYLTTSDALTFKVEGLGTNTVIYDLEWEIWSDNSTAVVNFQNYFDNLSQKDFVKSVMQDFGLLMQRRGDTNVYEFLSINDMMTDLEGAEDWSDKFDRQQSEEYKIGDYAQSNKMGYRYNGEEDYADGSFPIENVNIKEERTMFTSPYRAPKLSSNTIENEFLYQMSLYSVDLNDDNTIKEVKSTKGSSYLFRIKRIDTVLNYSVGGQPSVYNGEVPFASFEGLHYNEVIGNNYGVLQANLQVPIKRNVTMALTALDMRDLNFFRLKYLKQFMSYFYVNKVKGFKVGKVTKTELIRVLGSTSTGAEYSDDYNNDYNI